MTPAFGLAVMLGAPQTFDLRLRPASGKPVVLNAVEERTEGATRTTLGTRFEIVAGNGPHVIDLTTGPFTSGGRTFGRRKTSPLALTSKATLAGDASGRPPFLLSAPLPGRPVKAGDVWIGTIVGPTPMPAGVKATFRAIGPTKVGGAPCLRVGVKIDTELGGARITGHGESAVRLDDGLLQSGSLNVLLVYRRPDPVTHKVSESARVSVKARIMRS